MLQKYDNFVTLTRLMFTTLIIRWTKALWYAIIVAPEKCLNFFISKKIKESHFVKTFPKEEKF